MRCADVTVVEELSEVGGASADDARVAGGRGVEDGSEGAALPVDNQNVNVEVLQHSTRTLTSSYSEKLIFR